MNGAASLKPSDYYANVNDNLILFFKDIYIVFYDKCLDIAWNYCPAHFSKEDVVQDVFIKLFSKLDAREKFHQIYQLDGLEGIQKYLHTTVRNGCFDQMKKNKKDETFKNTKQLNVSTVLASVTKEICINHDLCENLQLFIFDDEQKNNFNNLTKFEKKIYLLKSHSLKIREIAKKLSISESGVKNALARARKKIFNTS